MTLTAKGLAPLTRIDTSLQESIDDLSVFLTPQMYAPVGATLGTGASQPLSGFYASLALAQVDFSFVTALTQQTDWACIQKMSYEALGYPTFEHADTNAYLNKMMFIPAGNYQIGADVWLIRNASGIKIIGAGRRSTRIYGSGIVFATDGLWYSQIEGIWFETTGAAAAVVDIDGNVPGHPYATRGVQANTFKDIGVSGGGLATYGLALTRQGNPPGPGAQGSEDLFLNCHFNACVEANWYSTGFNALNNTFIGGNFQSHSKYGIYIAAGSVYLFSVAFQSTFGYTQIINDGYDINANSAGVGERITVIGCRTESARFYRGAASQPPVLEGNSQNYGSNSQWFASTAYTLNQTAIKTSPTLGPQMYRVTTAGTSAGTEPVWPDSGTVTDGSVVWTMTLVKVVDCTEAYFRANSFQFGIAYRASMTESPTREITTDYTATVDDEFLLCIPTSNITIKLPSSASPQGPGGKRYYIKKENTNSSTITVQDSDGGFIEGVAGIATIPGGSRGWLVVERAGGGAVSQRYWIVSQDPEMLATTANTANKIVKRDANGIIRYSGTELESISNAEWIQGSTTEQITLNTGGTTTDSTANLLPANSVIESVVAVVDITITTATTWQVGDATTANRFISSVGGLGAGTQRVGLRHRQGSVTTDAAGPVQTAADKIRITTDVNPGAGKVRVVVFYSQFVAPTA